MSNLRINTDIIAGPNKLDYLNEYLNNSQTKSPLIIYDYNLYKKNEYFRNFLNKNNFKLQDKYEYNFEPSYQYVKKKLDIFRNNEEISKVDLIISIGGGSTIDYLKPALLKAKQ